MLSRTLNHFRNEIISVRNTQRRAITVEAPYISTQLAGVTRLRCIENEAVLTSQASSIEMNFRCISHLAMRTQFALPELPLLKRPWGGPGGLAAHVSWPFLQRRPGPRARCSHGPGCSLGPARGHAFPQDTTAVSSFLMHS